jgi:hypothetical protein
MCVTGLPTQAPGWTPTSTVKPCSIGPAAATRAREARLHGVGEARQFTGADLLPLRGAGQSGRKTPAAAVAKPRATGK